MCDTLNLHIQNPSAHFNTYIKFLKLSDLKRNLVKETPHNLHTKYHSTIADTPATLLNEFKSV